MISSNQVTDESLDSTRRMMDLCAEAKDAGIKTLVALDDQVTTPNLFARQQAKHTILWHKCCSVTVASMKYLTAKLKQGEQIEKIEGGLDSINADMGLAEKALKAMDLACGIFPKFWKKSEGFKEDDAIWGEQKGGGGGAPPPPGVEIPSGAFVAKITNDDREAEMEENMEQVSAMVGNLRNMANDMGSEVERQNNQLDRINLKAGSDITRVKMANDTAAALMK